MRIVSSFVFALFLLGLVIGCSGDKKDASQAPSTDQQSVGQTESTGKTVAAAWTAEDTRGTQQSASQWIGKQPTVINFWGTWCPPCRAEIPDLVRLYNEFKPQGVEIVGFAVRDQPANVEVFADEARMSWVMLMANDDVVDLYGPITGVPTTIFLDKDGKEVTRFVGAQAYEKFKPAFEAIAKTATSSM